MLVDDVKTMGGTMAELAHHIQANDNRVAGIVTPQLADIDICVPASYN